VDSAQWITADELGTALSGAGLKAGGIVMVHARLSAFPWIVGGVESVVHALHKAVGPSGTIAAYAGWEDNPYHLASWPADRQSAYHRGMPAFDPAVSEARRRYGRLPERIRTWPGAHRSSHPEMNLVAIGPKAEWLTRSDLDDDPWGPGSPLARLVDAEAMVLMLAAPLNALTLIHHAERIANVQPKRWVTYQMPISRNGAAIWYQFRAIDTSRGAYDYAPHVGEADYLETIVRSALDHGIGRQATIFGADCHMFPAKPLVEHATNWIEQRFSTT